MNIDELQAGRELDALIAKKIIGIPQCECNSEFCASTDGDGVFERCLDCNCYIGRRYSTNITAAWQVIEKYLEKFYFDLYVFPPSRWKATLASEHAKNDRVVFATAIANTAPLAICRAALKVKEQLNAT